MNGETKFVEFEKYCKTCKYSELSESEEPCWDCLENPVNVHSHKPINWEEADEKKKIHG